MGQGLRGHREDDRARRRDDATGAERLTYANANRQALVTAAGNALAANRTYLALATPTAAQTTAEVRRLAAQTNALIRFALEQFDGTD